MASGPKKIENRGGAREGAGRKPETLSVRQVQAMLDRAADHAKKNGKTIDDVLLEIAYSTEEKTADRLAAVKIFKTHTMAKLNEGGETDVALGPAFFLPEQRPDPAKIHVLPGGKT
jgi:hypothetical protein